MKLYKKDGIKSLIELNHDEIIEGFSKSKFSSERYEKRTGLAFYISAQEGLDCAFSSDEFEELFDCTLNEKNTYY